MADEIRDLANLDRLIHEPSRLAIMAVLSACASADFTYLLNATGLSKGNLSAHLSKLEEGGYVVISKSFKGKYPNTNCSLSSRRKACIHYLSKTISGIRSTPWELTYRAFLPCRLDRAKRNPTFSSGFGSYCRVSEITPLPDLPCL